MGSPSSPPPASTSWSTSSFRSRVRSPQATSPQHLLRTSHSWRSRLTRRTWPPPSTSSSSPSRSSTPASSSTQSSAQSDLPSEEDLNKILSYNQSYNNPSTAQP